MPIFSRQKKNRKEKEEKSTLAAKTTAKETAGPASTADQGSIQQKNDAADDTTPPPPSPPSEKEVRNSIVTTNKQEQSMLNGLLEHALGDTFPKETEDAPFDEAPFDEALVDIRSAHTCIKTGETTNAVDELCLHVNGESKADAVDVTEQTQKVKPNSKNMGGKSNTTSFGGIRFTKQSGKKSKNKTTYGTTPCTKPIPKASFFRRKSKKTTVGKEDEKIDKIDIKKKTEASSEDEEQQSLPVPEPAVPTKNKKDGATKSESTFPTEASTQSDKDDTTTDFTTDDETDTSNTTDDRATSCGWKELPSPLGSCTVLSKEELARKIDEAVIYIDKIVAPKLALALFCLSPEEESVELGYQENASRHRSRQSRRKYRSERGQEW
jgi:hypothetical protein